MLKKALKQFWEDKRLLLLIVFGTLSWSITMVKSGLPVVGGIGFWGANGHDGIWHLALANALARGTLHMPVFAGAGLQNYHIGFDLLLALLFRVTTIPVSVWYFQIIPPFLALCMGVLCYLFVSDWTGSKRAAWWSTFFVYFGGSFGFIVTLLRGQGISGESMFWSQQSISTLINPPFALSLVILLLALVTLQKHTKHSNKAVFVTAVILFSLLLSVKVYAGVLALGALFVQSIYEYLKSKSFSTFYIFVLSLFFSLILFLPLNKSAGGLIVFQPGWFLETMLAISDRFYWPKLFEAIINWRAAHVYYKALAGYLVAFFIFIIGNFGSRLLFLVLTPKIYQKKSRVLSVSGVTVFLSSIVIGGVLAPMLFLQKGTAWNTIQFLYYSLFVSALFSGIAVHALLSLIASRTTRRIVIALVILFTIPTTVSTLLEVYIPGRPPAMLPSDEVEALAVLKTLPKGVVLTYPFDPLLAKAAIPNPPRPLYLYDSTAYVAAYGNHDVYLEDEVNLTIMNYQWKDRRKALDEFYASTDQKRVYDFLRTNNITYIYWVKPQFTKIGDLQLKLTNVFENKTVIIYKVN